MTKTNAMRGLQIAVAPEALADFVGGVCADVIK